MPSMLLHPQDSLWKPRSLDEFEAELRAAGLIAAPLSAEYPRGFYAGNRFLSLIMFLGCSPRVDLDPGVDGSNACFLQLHPSDRVVFYSADKPAAVRCPACRMPLGELVTDDFDQQIPCPHCSRQSLASELDWRQVAGFASFAIEVHGIFPHEAVPADALLDGLRDYSQLDWKYIYIYI